MSNASEMLKRLTGPVFGVAARKGMLASAVCAGLVLAGGASAAKAAITDVTSVSTVFTTGLTTTVNGVKGYGLASSYSAFKPTSTYTVSYGGDTDTIKSLTAGGSIFTPTGQATSVVRRFASSIGSNNDQLWYVGTGTGTSHTLSAEGPALNGFSQAFAGNNLLVGADNIFSTTGNAVGNNSNVNRLDLIFAGGIKASSTSAFGVFDRGVNNDHDSFKIAAITGVDSSGNPTSYGPLITVADGTWGKTNVVAPTEELVFRKNNSITNDTLHPADSTTQAIGGVLVHTSDLVSAGTEIYGYSLFSPTVTGSGSQLVNWTNTTYYHAANSTSTGGGLDPVGVVGVLYTSVPEPTALAVGVPLALMALRRRNRSASKA